MQRIAAAVLVVLVAATVVSPPAHAQNCTREQFRKVVEDTGAALRRINGESRGRFDAGLKRLRERQGWSEEEAAEKAAGLLTDARSESYDRAVTDLFGKLDQLGEDAPGEPDCAKLAEIEATALELQAAVRVKMQHTIARLESLAAELGSAAAPAPAASAPATPPAVAAAPPPAAAPAMPKTASAPRETAPKAQPPAAPAAPAPPAAAKPAPPKPSGSGWSTTTVGEAPVPLPSAPGPVASATGPRPMPPVAAAPEADGYSIDEIREASRGFFGTFSAGLAGVIEHAVKSLGRPTGYVLGDEAGGAFIAGVRYGKGNLYLRKGGTREVFWHGPSIGYDIGASGSKVLFLVYNLRDPLDLFTGFSGVEGSAYLVGGVGMTVLTDGRVVMAPIRSGVGVRLGANVGYIRFTARATWNPF